MSDSFSGATPPPNAIDHRRIVNRTLWTGLIGGAVLNALLHAIGLGLIGVLFGLVALFSGIGLIARAIVAPKHR